MVKGSRISTSNTIACEFGHARGDYEIAVGRGYVMARPGTTPIVMVGDGTCVMIHSDICSPAPSGHKFILIVCDNGGYCVIKRPRNAKGTPGFNTLICDCPVVELFAVDFVKQAESMGELARRGESLADLEERLRWAQATDRTTVLAITTDAFAWVPGDAAWDVGVPEATDRETMRAAHVKQIEIRARQPVGG